MVFGSATRISRASSMLRASRGGSARPVKTWRDQ